MCTPFTCLHYASSSIPLAFVFLWFCMNSMGISLVWVLSWIFLLYILTCLLDDGKYYEYSLVWVCVFPCVPATVLRTFMDKLHSNAYEESHAFKYIWKAKSVFQINMRIDIWSPSSFLLLDLSPWDCEYFACLQYESYEYVSTSRVYSMHRMSIPLVLVFVEFCMNRMRISLVWVWSRKCLLYVCVFSLYDNEYYEYSTCMSMFLVSPCFFYATPIHK